MNGARRPRVLVARLDSFGDVLVAGPAVRAVAAGASHVTLLCGPQGAPAGRLLPGVDTLRTWAAPWVTETARPIDDTVVDEFRALVAEERPDEAVVLTSFHQSPVAARAAAAARRGPAGDRRVGGPPRVPPRRPAPTGRGPARGPARARACAADRAGRGLRAAHGRRREARGTSRRRPTGRRGRPGPVRGRAPGASVPARAWPAEQHRALVAAYAAAGVPVVVTGSPANGR